MLEEKLLMYILQIKYLDFRSQTQIRDQNFIAIKILKIAFFCVPVINMGKIMKINK